MKTVILLIVMIFGFIGSAAHAELIDRGGGLIYDTDYNITWYNNAIFNIDWNQADAWIQSLNAAKFKGFEDWRLPSALNLDGSGPSGPGYNITGSEMGHLYYTELGNIAYPDGYPGSGFINIGLMTTLGTHEDVMTYWTQTEYPNPGFDGAWGFWFGGGLQTISGKLNAEWTAALAVRDGDSYPEDIIAPTIEITSPTSAATYSTNTSPLSIGGVASDNIALAYVEWVSDRGGSGGCSYTTYWNCGGVSLLAGQNIITVIAYDGAGNSGIDILTVTYTPPDIIPPTLEITFPTSFPIYSTNSSQWWITVEGVASDNIGVAWVELWNDRVGSWICDGTISWSCSVVVLFEGKNVLTAIAYDEAGNPGTDTLTVTYDVSVPAVMITSPTSYPTYSTSSSPLIVGGLALDNVGVAQVAWTNDRGGSGSCAGTTSWICDGIALYSGDNLITVTAQDAVNNPGTGTLTVTYTPPDSISPTATISNPTPDPTYFTENSVLSIGGMASDNVGVTQVTWANDRGGSGNCSGTTSWSCSGITLLVGQNMITVTASDEAGNLGTDTLTVTYTPAIEAPDFAVTSIEITPTFPMPNSTFDATIKVRNQGLGPGDGGYLDVWITRDLAVVCGAKGDSRVSVGVLAAGETKTFFFPALPAGLEGNKTFRVFVDSSCSTSESNEGNNQRTFPYQVTAGCIYALNPEVWAFNASGGIGSFSISTGESCTWVPVSDLDWLIYQAGGTGPGTIYYSVLPNDTGVARMGNISVQGQTFTVLQAKSDFVDVDPDYWANSWIYAIYTAEIASGYGDGLFGPDDSVTREQMAVFIIKALNEVPTEGYCGTTNPFSDIGADRWSCKYIKRLSELGITTGYGDGRFGPEDLVTREQMAVFITKALPDIPPDGYCGMANPFTDVSYDRWSCKYVKIFAELGITTGYGDGRFGPDDYVTRAQMAVFLSRAFLGM